MSDTLVLDATGQPIYTDSWQKAVRLYFLDRASIVAEDEIKILHSSGFEMNMPRVIQLKNWVARKFKKSVPLCRRNLIVRDSVVIDGKPVLVCQYCGRPLTTETYSVDHVWPRSKGGLSVWTNLVACCQDCNSRKANKTLDELPDMQLLKKPVEPDPMDPKFNFKLHIRNPHPSWEPWLYWNVELEK
jgi:5-methylcytosine-specific restriction endonuclease McrA